MLKTFNTGAKVSNTYGAGESTNNEQDEHVESAWIPWSDLAATRITSSNSMIAIQHEALRRLIARNSDKDKPSLFS